MRRAAAHWDGLIVCAQVTDRSIPFMPRTEVIDVRSGAHLGHVFNGELHLCS